MNPIDYKNSSGVSRSQHLLSASPPNETGAFLGSQLHSEFQSKDFLIEVRGRRRSSSVDSINKSSDSAPLSENAQGTVYHIKKIYFKFSYLVCTMLRILGTQEFTSFLYVSK